jgi:hypothetical protein
VLLAASLNDYLDQTRGTKPIGGLFAGLGAFGLGTLLFLEYDGSSVPWLAAGYGSMLVGGASVFLLPEASQRDVLFLGVFAATGGIWTGLTVMMDAPPLTSVALASGYFTTSVLVGTNMLFGLPTARSVLQRDYQAVRTPAQRAALSEAQVASIEDHFRGTKRAIPPWALYLPMVLGGAVAAAPAFDGDRTHHERFVSGWAGGLSIVIGSAFMAVPVPFSEYEDRSKAAGLQIGVAPGAAGSPGLSLVGRF